MLSRSASSGTEHARYPVNSFVTSHADSLTRYPAGWRVCDRGEEQPCPRRAASYRTHGQEHHGERDQRAAFWAQEMTDRGSPGAGALHLERLGRGDRVTATATA